MRTCFVVRAGRELDAAIDSLQLYAGSALIIAWRRSDSSPNRTGTIGAKRQLYERLPSGQDRRNPIGRRWLQLAGAWGQG
jgi:hypothetical protein